MKHPTFIGGVVIALLFALGGAAAFTSLQPLLGPIILLKWLITTLAALYVAYLIAASSKRTGRLTIPVLWFAGTLALWLLIPGLTLYFIAQLAMVWLIRSLYFHTGMLPALLDLGLCMLSLLAAVATARHSQNIFLTIWSFFLTQALFVTIPSLLKRHRGEHPDSPELRFSRALHTAEAAVRRIHRTN